MSPQQWKTPIKWCTCLFLLKVSLLADGVYLICHISLLTFGLKFHWNLFYYCSSWWAVDLVSHSTDTNKDTKKAGKKTSSADGVMERAVFSCPVIFASFHMRLLRCPKINWFQFKLFVNIICWIRCQSLVHRQAALATGRHQIAQLAK